MVPHWAGELDRIMKLKTQNYKEWAIEIEESLRFYGC